MRHYLPERAAQWSAKVDSHRSNLLSYILFLRITPFLPNWFINIVSPVIGVPLLPFWMGTFFGVAPPSFIFIQVFDELIILYSPCQHWIKLFKAGTTLQQLSSTMDPITVETVLLLVVFALLSLAPILLKNKLKTKFEWLCGQQGWVRTQTLRGCCTSSSSSEDITVPTENNIIESSATLSTNNTSPSSGMVYYTVKNKSPCSEK